MLLSEVGTTRQRPRIVIKYSVDIENVTITKLVVNGVPGDDHYLMHTVHLFLNIFYYTARYVEEKVIKFFKAARHHTIARSEAVFCNDVFFDAVIIHLVDYTMATARLCSELRSARLQKQVTHFSNFSFSHCLVPFTPSHN